MKTTIIALSLLTSLISAAPVSNGTVLIILNTGGGNISTQVTVPYGTLVDASCTFPATASQVSAI